ncbi:NAD-dependent succinate-semialdehyde dehydrogenase [Pseudoalteromonas sp. OOF1S-7]|uniref:NAD-dependent succinate-semialdehyde dehydrogenase n=1 Tax=Pseudoalteromonas sp. OOF1S-7 TaxID=2917757 RepID=UPI001EF57F9C|nr:NAD-dependent succinate-semialdehyde dehydrogenase [Pseudoalteromonas sp. OOF1S-7]MCG7534462.1 NAD-dependent succinate-semialdehyde dehydrogenase [Pseudoalteromonas sp. OOF1S-7]
MTLITEQAHSWVNGNPWQSQRQLTVHNPANDVPIATVSIADHEAAEQALNAAQACFDILKQRPAQQRAEVLLRWYHLILDHQAALAELMTTEQGKPLSEALAEVRYAAGFVQWFAEEARRAYGEVIPSHSAGHQLITVKQPIGVVLGITPWNFPLAMITRKVAPAYAAGCPFILKPSEETPLSAIALAKLALEAGFESAAFQVLVSDDAAALVAPLLASPVVRKLTFTGSTAVGKKLLALSADTVKRTSMELGGNAPFIVFSSADVHEAVAGLMIAKFRNGGQTCVAANRVFVHQDIHEAFTDALIEAVEKLRVGDGLEANTDIGPLINAKAKDKAEYLVEDALSKGAQRVFQGTAGAGHFMAPTILRGVSEKMDIYHQEIFAPVVSIIAFSDESSVVRQANDVKEGLAAYFYSQDVSQIHRVSMALEYGMVGINEGAISNPVAPFGGVKQSGLGREGAKEGLQEFLESKYLCQKFSS